MPPGFGTAPICRASSPPSKCENSAVSKLSHPPVGAKPGGVNGPVFVPVMRSRAATP